LHRFALLASPALPSHNAVAVEDFMEEADSVAAVALVSAAAGEADSAAAAVVVSVEVEEAD
jgi:hypothetical protein